MLQNNRINLFRKFKILIRPTKSGLKYVLGLGKFPLMILILCITPYALFIDTTHDIIIRGNASVPSTEIYDLIHEDIKSKSLVQVDTEAIERKLADHFIIFEKVSVSKSIILGYIVDVQEFKPLGMIYLNNGKILMLTSNGDLVFLKEKIPGFPVVIYNQDEVDQISLEYAKKTFQLYEFLKSKIVGEYTFDNFGNLFILVSGEKVIRFDLNERFLKLKEQVKILETVLDQNIQYKEIDIRFSYLLLK